MRLLLPLCLAVMAAAACSTPPVTDTGSDGYIIRYININAVYEYAVSGSNEAVTLRNKRNDILKKIKSRESRATSGGDQELDHYRRELEKLELAEKKFKAAVFSRIKTAVESVAERHEVDFMLSTGEGVVYSRPVYDLTAEVISELDKMNKNSSPLWK